jgi:PKD repeat protein
MRTLLALALVLGVAAGSGGTTTSGHAPPTHATLAPRPARPPASPAPSGSLGTIHLGGSPVGDAGYAGGPPGGPVAYFVATDPVAPGAPVSYTDESYDTTPGATIVRRVWQGRAATFTSPGLYTVRLTVTDSLGRISTYSTDILVSASVAPNTTGHPYAFFLVTSPVAVGQAVAYTDESYDMAPGARIVNEIWTGRQPSFDAPGTYPVSLRVEDSAGVWSATFTRDVTVLPLSSGASGSQPTGAPPPPADVGGGTGGNAPSLPVQGPIAWTAGVAPDPAPRGSQVVVTAVASAAVATPPRLEVPPPLWGTWGGVSYANSNASGPMTRVGPTTFTRTLEVPASASFPAGPYDLVVQPPGGAQPITLALLVQGAASYEEPLTEGM